MKLRLPKTRRYRIYLYVASTLLTLYAIDQLWVRLWQHISISHETTRITAPLNAQGTPDYLASVNATAAEGVTRDNNAAIPMFQLFSMYGISTRHQEEICRQLEMPVPAPRPDLFMEYERFYNSRHGEPSSNDRDFYAAITQKVSKEQFDAMKKPWSAQEHPDLAAWVAAHETVLSQLPAIAARSRYYVPAVSNDGLLLSRLSLNWGQLRVSANLLVMRALLRVQEGQFAQARADLVTCHRLARLQAQNRTLVDYMSYVLMDQQAFVADIAFATTPGIPATELRQHLAEIQSLPEAPPLSNALESERLAVLDAIVYVANNPRDRWKTFVPTPDLELGMGTSLWLHLTPAHYNAALTDVNRFFDENEAALKQPTYSGRTAAAEKLDRDIQQYDQAHRFPSHDPARSLLAYLIPTTTMLHVRIDAQRTQQDLAQLALALALYHADHQRYPASLAELVPAYFKDVPADRFVDAPLRYHSTGDGYLCYSLGRNQRDDHGYPSSYEFPAGFFPPGAPQSRPDDIAIRVPAAIPAPVAPWKQ